ncbi:MAG: PilC/PilY family type IV pilus protein [Myxococcales bacterium]|nr:PilC/PilY family type IV pilus protein [Myxococcales bacterium]
MRIEKPLTIAGFLACLIVSILLTGQEAAAQSGDVALFSTTGSAVAPNILIVLDSSGSMRNPTAADPGGDDKDDIARATLTALVQTVNPPDGSGGYEENARFGLFIFSGNGTRGGELLVPIADDNTQAMLDGIAGQGSTSVGTVIARASVDAGRYAAGSDGWGSLPVWGDKAGETLAGNPIDVACRATFLIIISDGLESDGDMQWFNVAGVETFWPTIGDADGDSDPGEVEGGDSLTWLDDVAYALYRADLSPLDGLQNVMVHTVGFDIDDPLLEAAAAKGGGQYRTANNATELANALSNAVLVIFESLASFSSSVVITSQSGTGAIFYNAFFEPSVDEPVWAGHLEAYPIAPGGAIVDASGNPAVDPSTSQFVEPHNPLWDAGEVLQTDTSRSIYTTVAGARAVFEAANVTDITAAELDIVLADAPLYPNYPGSGVDTLAELRTAIIDYVHGKDGFDQDGDSSRTDMRSIVLGDIFHSTPLVVAGPSRLLLHEPGYQAFWTAYKDRDYVSYVGANDGLLHAFDVATHHAGDNLSTPEVEAGWYDDGSGAELFGYVPGILLDVVKLMPRNVPRTTDFVDGNSVAADAWLGDGSGILPPATEWTTVLVTGLRDGGRGYLGLDVTNPDAGDGDPHGPYPKLLWEFTHADLGNTWSTPVLTRIKQSASSGYGDHCGHDDGDGDCIERWVAIFGGGYEADGNPNNVTYVDDPASASWSDRSKAIFMVALDTGELLASVEFDASGTDGPAEMKYSIASTPAVLDLDFDGFSDVVYVGDLGGQLWKWDIRAVGADGADADTLIDNFPAGVFFRTDPVTLAGGDHFRSFFFPPAAGFVHRKLTLAFGTGEREDLGYEGDPTEDDENRFYVLRDLNPTGASAFSSVLTESDISGSDVTNLASDPVPSDPGFFFKVADGEKFVTDVAIFGGQVIVASYTPQAGADVCATSAGQAFLYVFELDSSLGYFGDPNTAPDPQEDRRTAIGGGLPSSPDVTMSRDPADDKIYIKTSSGQVITIDAPFRDSGLPDIIYWRQVF